MEFSKPDHNLRRAAPDHAEFHNRHIGLRHSYPGISFTHESLGLPGSPPALNIGIISGRSNCTHPRLCRRKSRDHPTSSGESWTTMQSCGVVDPGPMISFSLPGRSFVAHGTVSMLVRGMETMAGMPRQGGANGLLFGGRQLSFSAYGVILHADVAGGANGWALVRQGIVRTSSEWRRISAPVGMGLPLTSPLYEHVIAGAARGSFAPGVAISATGPS